MKSFVFRTPLISYIMGRILVGENTPSLRDRLLKAATGAFGLRVASTGFSFVLSLVLARVLGLAGYGMYSYVLSLVAVAAVPALFGLDRLLVREIAVYETRSEWPLLRGIMRWANRTAVVTSLGLALLAAGVVWMLADHLGVQLAETLYLGLIMLPLLTFVHLRQAVMQGLNHVVVALVPDSFVRPLCLIAFLGCTYLVVNEQFKPQWAVGLNALAVMVALLVATRLLQKALPEIARDAAAAYRPDVWVRSAIPMMLISGMNVMNHQIDTIMLGVMKEVESVGIYTVAHRGAQLILLVQTVVNVALGPTIAGLYAAGEMRRLQRVITKSAQVVSAISFSIALCLILFSAPFFSLFGSEFIQGRVTLAILAAGCLINAATGSVGLLLVMTGHERTAAMGVGIGLVINVALNAILIPFWGAAGAATSASLSMIARNLLNVFWAYKRVGIHSTILGRIGAKS